MRFSSHNTSTSIRLLMWRLPHAGAGSRELAARWRVCMACKGRLACRTAVAHKTNPVGSIRVQWAAICIGHLLPLVDPGETDAAAVLPARHGLRRSETRPRSERLHPRSSPCRVPARLRHELRSHRHGSAPRVSSWRAKRAGKPSDPARRGARDHRAKPERVRTGRARNGVCAAWPLLSCG